MASRGLGFKFGTFAEVVMASNSSGFDSFEAEKRQLDWNLGGVVGGGGRRRAPCI